MRFSPPLSWLRARSFFRSSVSALRSLRRCGVHAPREEVGAVLQDMNFVAGATSGEEGIALFRRIRELDPDLPVLAMTAWTSLQTAVQMVKEGATDYLAKPWDDDKLLSTVKNLLRMRALSLENERLKREKARAHDDLAARYDLCGLEVPALRDRPEDVLPLARAFLDRVAGPEGRKQLSSASRAALYEHSWPGNVRELMNCIRRAVLVASGAEITPEDLGLENIVPYAEGHPELALPAEAAAGARLERQRLESLLRACDGMVSKAAVKLGMSRQALYRRMQRLGITLERRPKL